MQDLIALARAEFEGSAALRAEFIDLPTYTAWRKATTEGRVKVLGSANNERPQTAIVATRHEGRDLIALARAEFDGSAALRAEFINLEVYTAYRKAQAAGHVRVFGEHRESPTEERVAPSIGHAVAALGAANLDRIATRRFCGAA